MKANTYLTVTNTDSCYMWLVGLIKAQKDIFFVVSLLRTSPRNRHLNTDICNQAIPKNIRPLGSSKLNKLCAIARGSGGIHSTHLTKLVMPNRFWVGLKSFSV